jgi:hypothetical protein
MRHILHFTFKRIVFVVFLFPFALFAQNDTLSYFRLKTVSENIGFNFLTLTDPYLSPLEYSGNGLNYNHSSRRFLFDNNTRLSRENRSSLLIGMLYNPTSTASMSVVQGTYSWGMHHHFYASKNTHFLVGGNVNGMLGAKYIARNVNNPVNADFAVNLNLSALFRQNLSFGKFKCNLQLRAESPVIGAMFVPPLGASYYEMFDVGSPNNAFHFSSFHNKFGLEYGLALFFPLRSSTLFVDINKNSLLYQTDYATYTFDCLSVSIGWKYDLYIFAGTKKPAPRNFLSTDNFNL